MPCYSPLQAYYAAEPNAATGKYSLVFNPGKLAASLEPVEVPCGRCIGCRLERSRQWALRITHEQSLHSENCFITLTYDPEHLPYTNSLDKDHFQRFMKRLRKFLSPRKIRFFACGEYGDENYRPHYHAIIFGYDFPDKVACSKNQSGDIVYTSEILLKIWGMGFVTVGGVTFESAAYVARYVCKKVTGDAAIEHYTRVDPETGEMFFIEPEFALMSRKPGIARDWYEKYRSDLNKGFITSRGIKMMPPKYYTNLLEKDDPFLWEHLKNQRIEAGLANYADNTAERLAVKEVIKKRKFNQLKRNL